jgi:ribosomal protein S18 acetylase RimI-like enzyme
MDIRPLRNGDSQHMQEIARRAFMDLGLARYAIDNELDREKVEDCYAREAAGYATRVEKGERAIHILIAEESGAVVGYIVLAIDEANSKQFGIAWGRIVSLAVHPDHQGKGAGKALVAEGLDWLSTMGVTYAEVLTDQNNVGAQRAYEANGFRAVYASISFSRRLDTTS